MKGYIHRERGHDTDDCPQLKREIETLICRGYLGKYVDKPGPSKKWKEPMEPPVDNRPTEHEVNLLDRLSIGRKVSMISKETSRPPKKQRIGEETSEVSFLDKDIWMIGQNRVEPCIKSSRS